MPSVFTRIIDGELPGHFVWQDEQCVALLTIEPIREGHVLLIPRQEVDHWDDLTPELAAHLMQVGQKIARALKSCYPQSRRIGMMIAGLEVPHAHIHLIPIESEGQLSFAHARSAPADLLAQVAQNITLALENQTD